MNANLEMLIKFIQNQAHAIHEAIHVGRCALVVSGASVRQECFLEGLKVLHPVECKIVRLCIDFVENNNEGKLCLVEYTVKHERYLKRDNSVEKGKYFF